MARTARTHPIGSSGRSPPREGSPVLDERQRHRRRLNRKVIHSISPRSVFLLQGGRDTTVPPDSGQRLYDAAGEPIQLWFDPKLEHCEFWWARPKEYERRVVAFFDQYLLGK